MEATRLWAEIDLNALAFNLRSVKRAVGPHVDVLGTVKANAYGHGAVEVSRELSRCGVRMLGVASVAEGIELREAGLRKPVIVLGAVLPEEIPDAVKYRITLTLSPPEILGSIASQVARQDRSANVHIMVDTGMTRVGVDPKDVPALAGRVKSASGVKLEGIATHFPLADGEDQGCSCSQLDALQGLREELARDGIRPEIWHSANSSAVAMLEKSHLTMVRPGLALYGMFPDPAIRHRLELRPVLSLKSRIVYLRDVAAGTPVGYGHTWLAPTDTRIATVAVGYGDGYSRACSNRSEVIHRGRRAPVVGRVSMDYTTIDLGPNAEASTGDMVTLIGRDGDEMITAEEMAGWRDTIPYEVTCSLGSRVRSVHLRSREPRETVRV